MANLPESSTFDAGVYQIETNDPVIGGPSGVTNTPLKNLANRTKYLKDQVDSLASTKAPLASPAFTGTPTVPTAAAGTNTTQAASTAFVSAAVSGGTADNALKLGGVPAADYAPKASPVFTGNPVAPTAPQFDNDTSLATTAFVQRALGNMQDAGILGVNQILTASDAGKWFIGVTSSATVKLPAVSSLANGSTFQITAGGASLAVQSQDGSVIYLVSGYAPAAAAAFSLLPSESCVIVKYGSYFYVTNRTGGSPLGGTGYQKMPSGLIIQWGVASSAVNAFSSVNFAVAFPATCVSVSIQPIANPNEVTWFQTIVEAWPGTTSFRFASSSGSVRSHFWTAIGY